MPLPVKLTVANWLAFTLLSLFPRGAGERWNFDINLLLQRNYSYWRGEKLLLSRANDENVKICHRKSYTKSKTWQLSHLGESLSQSFNFLSGCFFFALFRHCLDPHSSEPYRESKSESFFFIVNSNGLTFFSTLNFFLLMKAFPLALTQLLPPPLNFHQSNCVIFSPSRRYRARYDVWVSCAFVSMSMDIWSRQLTAPRSLYDLWCCSSNEGGGENFQPSNGQFFQLLLHTGSKKREGGLSDWQKSLN